MRDGWGHDWLAWGGGGGGGGGAGRLAEMGILDRKIAPRTTMMGNFIIIKTFLLFNPFHI